MIRARSAGLLPGRCIQAQSMSHRDGQRTLWIPGQIITYAWIDYEYDSFDPRQTERLYLITGAENYLTQRDWDTAFVDLMEYRYNLIGVIL